MITGVIAEHLMHQPARPRCNLTNVLGQRLVFFVFFMGGFGEADAAMQCSVCASARRSGGFMCSLCC